MEYDIGATKEISGLELYRLCVECDIDPLKGLEFIRCLGVKVGKIEKKEQEIAFKELLKDLLGDKELFKNIKLAFDNSEDDKEDDEDFDADSVVIRDIISIDDLDVKRKNNSYHIEYKDVLLFHSINDTLEGYDVYVLDETSYRNGFVTITLRDNLGDIYHYGKFSCVDKLKEWLKYPVELY